MPIKRILVWVAVAIAGGHADGADRPTVSAAPVPRANAWDGEWTQWRGPGRTNISGDTGLLRGWPEGGPPLLWKAEGIGDGVPSVAVAGGRVYTLGYGDNSEVLTAADAATGARVWAAQVGPRVAEQPAMRWLSQRTPTVDGERVYSVSARGVLTCSATADGAPFWRKDYVTDFGGRPGVWGYCDFPLVDGERLICSPGGARAAVVALDKATGDTVWECAVPGVERATYGGIVAADLAGVRQYVHQFDRGAVGVGRDGRVLWQYGGTLNQKGWGNVHTAVPLGGDRIFCSAGWGVGGTTVRLSRDGDALAAAELYPPANRDAFDAWIGNSSLVGEHVYTNTGRCIEPLTGKVTWRERLGQRVTVVVADGHLYYRRQDGTVIMAEVNAAAFRQRGTFAPPRPATSESAWTSPVIAGGRMYLRDKDLLLCYDLRADRAHPFQPPGRRPTTTAARSGEPGAPATRPAPAANDGDGREAGRPLAGRDAIFVPTPQDVVERMLELARVGKDDVVYDLGCGDGRIVVTAAAKYGCRAVGFDTDPECVRLAERLVAEREVGALVTIRQKDVFTVDLSGASVVTLYMGGEVNRRLTPQLRKLKPGARVVSHAFEIEGLEPDQVVEMVSAEDDARHLIYVWTVPFRNR